MTGAAAFGIPGGDSAKVTDLFHQKYRGSRYSFGYPACPSLEDQTKIFKFPQPEKSIGVQLTESARLEAEQSARATLVRHPQARNFVIQGCIVEGEPSLEGRIFGNEIDDGQGGSQSHRGALASQSIL